jgi:predicted ArsR family transcriptional regulator
MTALRELPPSVPSITSEDAADAIRTALPRIRAAVLRRLRYVALTADELEEVTTFTGNTIRPRLRELQDAGLIRRTEAMRPTRAGRQAFVYTITAAGLVLLNGQPAA